VLGPVAASLPCPPTPSFALFASRMALRERTEQADFFLPFAPAIDLSRSCREDPDPVGKGRPAQ
jgi:hypothetical protein